MVIRVERSENRPSSVAHMAFAVGDQPTLRTGSALRWRRIRTRSRSEQPPHTPWSMWFSSAYSKHSRDTGHVAQIFCATTTPTPSRGKKTSQEASLHFPWFIHSAFIVALRVLHKDGGLCSVHHLDFEVDQRRWTGPKVLSRGRADCLSSPCTTTGSWALMEQVPTMKLASVLKDR